MNNKIYEQYLREKDIYKIFGEKIKILVKELMDINGINYQSITCRTKDEKSLLNKLERKKYKYKDLKEISDISGIRIITYYSDSVDKVAQIISEQFEVDTENTIDKRKALDPDRFGYLSLHYVVSLKKDRLNLPEYSMFKDLKLEIQIRSISQHTWAEIEHDLGYKSEIGLPKDIRRDFYRLAGLLELVDKEFIEIRDKLENYKKDLEIKIREDKEEIFIDDVSLSSYINVSSNILELNKRISESINGTFISTSDLIESTVKELKWVGFQTIKDIDIEIEKNKEGIYNLAKNILKDSESKQISTEVSLLYLCYYKLCESDSIDKLNKFIKENGFERNYDFSKKLISIYKEFKK